jgi:hypothetical protein
MMSSREEQSAQSNENNPEPNGVVEAGQRGQGQTNGQTGGSSGTMLPGLQEQIAQALQPLMGNLREQVAQAIRQEQAANGGPQAESDEGTPAEEGQPGDMQGSLRGVFAQVATAIRTAVKWIVRMARAVIAAIRSWLQKLSAALSKFAVSMALSGAKSAARPVLKAVVNKGVEALEQRGKETLGSVRDNAAKPKTARAAGAA